jgi:hypothetical protein
MTAPPRLAAALSPEVSPALERWRRAVLADKAAHAPETVAAAYELTAVIWRTKGIYDGWAACRYFARCALAGVRPGRRVA